MLGTRLVLLYFRPVSFFLRLAGITNAAVWFGAAVFFTAAVGPAFRSGEMAKILPPSHSGAAALVMMGSYFVLQYWCAAIALIHFALEWLYAGKPLRRWPVYLITGLLGLGLVSGMFLQPKLAHLHLQIHGVRSTPQQREQASSSFGLWKGILRVSNLLAVLGLWVYVWEMSNAATSTRFVSAGKLRS